MTEVTRRWRLSIAVPYLIPLLYPLEPTRVFMFTWGFWFAVAIGATVFILIRIESNEVLSKIAHTEPGKIWSWAFFSNAFVYGAVPVAFLVASFVPGAVDWLATVLRFLAKPIH